MQFFQDVFIDEEFITYVFKVLASTLTLGNKLCSFLFFIGSGSNGKTTLSNMLKYALGDYTATPNVSLFLSQSVTADKPNPHMYELNNARIAICEEPDVKSVTITGDAKAITGNVGILRTRILYQNLESIYVDLLPIINTNYKLTITNIDTALIDRIIAIPFLQRFLPKHQKEREEKAGDTHVKIKMVQPLWQGRHLQRLAPAFMHLLLDYYQEDYTKVGMPVIVRKHAKDFILRCDHVGRFIKSKLEDVYGEENTILYDNYQKHEEKSVIHDGEDTTIKEVNDDTIHNNTSISDPFLKLDQLKNISNVLILKLEDVYGVWFLSKVVSSLCNHTYA
ncbi:hypothetical protein BCR36DRAFT_366648 [Piromyces finnis]|uniref:SF3 helicase domain-containing protein n=1 Tax=Piromyces finnis TaxID=1754191 RepID=A0A1Y1VK07_9FUNG|nr:hypothetical protein BCR36DRAFT_366648 [Piromyces finnis]|eukprot:ORX58434.1 hypothetical protein BCR36DRAFT_366648 [Piromyces finnis]